MWHNHPFSQRNNATKTGGIGVCAGTCVCMVKREGEADNIGVFHKIGG